MQFKSLVVAALGGAALVQGQSLTSVLANGTGFSSLYSFLNNSAFAPLVSQLSMANNITLLAPTNLAFTKLLNSSVASMLNNTAYVTALLQYHVIMGALPNITALSFPHTTLMNTTYSNVTGGQVLAAAASPAPIHFTGGLLQAANVSGGAIPFTGGYIYGVDSFVIPPVSVSATAAAANLTSLVGALTYANLTGAVNSLADVTIFAPSNAAFAALAGQNVTSAQVASILTYHVVRGPPVYYSTVLTNRTLTTLGGGNITISVGPSGVFVNQARVIVPNVLVAGGVVHVIDSVLNPMNSTAMPNPSVTTGVPAFSSASGTAGLPFTSNVASASTMIATTSAPGASATKSGAAMPMRSGAIGAAALFGGAAAVAYNW